MTCSTCDGYELVPAEPDDPASELVACPDCPPKLRCPVHGRIVVQGGTCCECRREAAAALELVADLTHAAAVRTAAAEAAAIA